MSEPAAAWAGLGAAWHAAFELMWEAYDSGTIPVGAVVSDAAGQVVARGRNRIFDAPGGGGLAGTRLAHAEVNALVGLRADRVYPDSALLTTLEPCHLCVGAAIAVRVGRVHYASRDAWGGAAGRLVESRDTLAHPVVFAGPLPGALGLLPEVLLVAHFLWRLPGGNVESLYREVRPELHAAARALLELGFVPGAGGTLDSVRAAALPLLAGA